MEERGERMVVALPLEIQLAIKLRARKNHCRTGDVVKAAIRATFPNDIIEALDEMEEAKCSATR